MDYLMTLYAPLEAGQDIDSSLEVSNVRPGGWVKGPPQSRTRRELCRGIAGALSGACGIAAPSIRWCHAMSTTAFGAVCTPELPSGYID
jgi:hypothetical protein